MASGRDGRRKGRGQIRRLVAAYFGAIVILAIAIAISLGLAMLVYPALGIALSRHVGDRVRWASCQATIANVSQAKLKFIMRWPWELPRFIAQAFVAKHL